MGVMVSLSSPFIALPPQLFVSHSDDLHGCVNLPNSNASMCFN